MLLESLRNKIIKRKIFYNILMSLLLLIGILLAYSTFTLPDSLHQFKEMYNYSAGFSFTNGKRIKLNPETMTYREKIEQIIDDPEDRGVAKLFTSAYVGDLDKVHVVIHPWCSGSDGAARSYGPNPDLWVDKSFKFNEFKRNRLQKFLDFRPWMKNFYKWSEKEYKEMPERLKEIGITNRKGYIF